MQTLFATVTEGIVEEARGLVERIDALPPEDKVLALNEIRAMLHEVSPFRDEPVDCVS